jgi:hypothetical protein
MAYDLCGENPTGPEGKHFRRSIFVWPNIVGTCEDLAPEECRPCEDWIGDGCPGHGLNREQSLQLAIKLDELLATGRVAASLAELREPGCDENDIRAFAAFLKVCGGFTIS